MKTTKSHRVNYTHILNLLPNCQAEMPHQWDNRSDTGRDNLLLAISEGSSDKIKDLRLLTKHSGSF